MAITSTEKDYKSETGGGGGSETTTTIGALINSATTKATPIDADQIGLMDSAASNILKKLSWANLKATAKTYFDTLYQTLNANLTTISGLTPSNDDVLQRKAGAWINRTLAQLKADLILNLVDNTSDATKNAAFVTLTNKTIAEANNTITIKRSIMWFCGSIITAPTDSTDYFFGNVGTTETTYLGQRIYFPVACTIKAAIFNAYKAVAASNENVGIYIRLNNTTDYTVSTTAQFVTGFGNDQVSNTSMSVPIAAGDYINLKISCPAWATNPTNIRLSMCISIEG